MISLRIKKNPPKVDDRATLSRWFCEQHNIVNTKLGKEKFNCDNVLKRWRRKDGDI
jgi:mitochondrial FAD-linked sulfhydryl oxidase